MTQIVVQQFIPTFEPQEDKEESEQMSAHFKPDEVSDDHEEVEYEYYEECSYEDEVEEEKVMDISNWSLPDLQSPTIQGNKHS